MQLERLMLNALLNLATSLLRFVLRRLELWLTDMEEEEEEEEVEGSEEEAVIGDR